MIVFIGFKTVVFIRVIEKFDNLFIFLLTFKIKSIIIPSTLRHCLDT